MKKIFSILALTAMSLSAGPERWEKDIAKFEAAAEAEPPPKRALLFVGSSSIRLWDLATSFPNRDTINRGFGGSELEDSLHFADRIVIPHQPKIIFLYAGDNDIQGGKSAARVVSDYRKFVAKIHASLPQTEIVFLPIKPSLSRWQKWPEMKKANQAIRALAKKDPLLHDLDTVTPMLGEDGRPKPGLFQKDGLHLNRDGYLVWTKVVSDWLATRAAAAPASE